MEFLIFLTFISLTLNLVDCNRGYHSPAVSFQPTNSHGRDKPLYCYSCNENQPACSVPTLNLQRLNTEHYVPCNGQCMQYQNQWDDYSNYLN